MFIFILIIRYTNWKESICSFPRPFTYICLVVGFILHAFGIFHYFKSGDPFISVIATLSIFLFLCFNSICKVVHCVILYMINRDYKYCRTEIPARWYRQALILCLFIIQGLLLSSRKMNTDFKV